MFAHDLCHIRIEYFRISIDSNIRDRATCGVVARRAKPQAILKFFNLQFSFPACPGWDLGFGILDCGLRPGGFIKAYAPEGSRLALARLL